MPKRIGAIYIATGKKFIDEACNSAASLKNVMPDMPLAIFADEDVKSSHFETFTRIDAPKYGFVDKITNMGRSPFDYTLFLDTDTYLCENIADDLFPLLEHFDIAAAHAPNRAVYQVPGVPDSFPEFNSGVILFKKSPQVMGIFSEWRNLYERDLKKEIKWVDSLRKNLFKDHLPDQATFREALYHSNVRIATLSSEYNCRFNFPGFVQQNVKIFHGRHKDVKRIARILNAKIVPRAYTMRRGRLRVFAQPQSGEHLISQVIWSMRMRGFWETLAVAKRRLFNE